MACNAPHPLDGLNRSGTAQVDGFSFRVNWNLTTAQATRTNAIWRPDLGRVVAASVVATERVTGCIVKPGSALGDVALINMNLDCSTRR